MKAGTRDRRSGTRAAATGRSHPQSRHFASGLPVWHARPRTGANGAGAPVLGCTGAAAEAVRRRPRRGRPPTRDRAESAPRTTQAAPRGAYGFTRRDQPFSSGVRSPLALLHRTQQATRFSQVSRPPRLRGRTWSTVVAWPPQYAQRCASRRSTPRRLTGTARPCGARTYRARRMTEGRGRVSVPPTTGLPAVGDHGGLAGEDEHEGPAERDDGERFVPGVEHQCAHGQSPPFVRDAHLAGGVTICRGRSSRRLLHATAETLSAVNQDGSGARTTEGAASRGKRRLHGSAQRYVAEPHRHVRPPDFVPRRARVLLTGASNRRWQAE